MEIKDYHIEMLSVGAADAFIIYIIDENDRENLVLIDSGNYSDGQKIINHIRRYYDNPVIDVAVVTHPDDDHYGGFVKMLEKIQNKEKDAIVIKKFWVNDPGNEHIDIEDVKNGKKQAPVNCRAQRVYDLNDQSLQKLNYTSTVKQRYFHVILPRQDFLGSQLLGRLRNTTNS